MKLKKIIIIFTIFMPCCVIAKEPEIVTINNKKYCYIDDQKQNGFQIINGKTYFFSRAGDNQMRTGTILIDGYYYHFNEDGTMYTGIFEENGDKYYYNTVNGKRIGGLQNVNGKTYFFSRVEPNKMRTGEFSIDGFEYKFNKDGTMYTGIYDNGEYKIYYGEDGKKGSGLQTYKGKTYFFSRVEPNKMRTGEFIIDGFQYKFNEDGTMYTGIYDNGKYKVYYGEDGKKGSGLQTYKGKTYFFSRVEPNKMRTGEFIIDGFQYKFNEDGTMYTGIYDNGKYKVYYGEDGKKKSGFQKINGETYFFSRVGNNEQRQGLIFIDGNYYYFNEKGIMETGLKTMKEGTRFFDNNGVMKTGIQTINNNKYFFNLETGFKSSGFQEYEGNTYFFSRVGENQLRTGFFSIDYEYYYFTEDGIMQKGFQIVENKKRFFSRIDGKMRKGWINVDGNMYYADENTGEIVVGERTIDNIKYTFLSDGKLKSGFVTDSNGNRKYYFSDGRFADDWYTISGTKYFFNSLGVLVAENAKKVIDVSYHNSNIDWETVKKYSDVDAVIIRGAYRGYETGKLVDDTKLEDNINGAKNNNFPIGIYVYSQAINETEAREEAEKLVSIANKYGGKNTINLPLIFDTEYTGVWSNGARAGRADNLTPSRRTDIAIAFAERVKELGYEPMIYASKSFLEKDLQADRLSNYKLWIAQYNHYCTYNGPGQKTMWQYTSTEKVPGISTNVDVSVMY